jgi:DsbC/DsbD-like thiol-disulfide interchange protein
MMILARAARPPVTATLELPRRVIVRGETVEATLTLTIEAGFRIESVKGGGAARPTAVQLGLAEGLVPGEMRFPEGSVDPLGGERLRGYVGAVSIRFPVTAAPDCLPGTAPIAARVLFQATDGGKTLVPDQLELRAEIEVVARAG